MQFEGKTALITGSGRGIGRVIALQLASKGADIVVNYFRNREPAESTAEEIRQLGRRAEVVKANVGDPDSLKSLFEEVDSLFDGLDILINNAASGYNRPVMEQRVKGWDWTMNINARAALFASQHAVPLMEKRGGGHIVSLSSIGSRRVFPEYVMVGTSKAALEALTRYLGAELSAYNIVVNAVSAGPVQTDALQYFPGMKEEIEKRFEEYVEQTPAKRVLTSEDIAGVVAFLCSKEAFMIRGQTLVIDGGFTL